MSATVDRTMEFLSVAARSRGLSHQVTHNISLINFGFQKTRQESMYGPIIAWKWGEITASKKVRPKHRQDEFNAQGLGAFEEVVKMAEGKSGITLGRAEFHRRRA